MNQYSIGQISKLVGLPPKTIRFYEETGVITSPSRSENGYRQYSQTNIEELQVLKYARDLGLPLGEIKKLMQGCEHGDCHHSKTYINETIDTYINQLIQKIVAMNTLKTKLQELKEILNAENPECTSKRYCCNILHQLIMIPEKRG